MRFVRSLCTVLASAAIFWLAACTGRPEAPKLNREELAVRHFQQDTAWYLENIPFFECSDREMESVYYYRWKLYKAHLRKTGDDDYIVTEFINHVGWDREPFCTINAASMHHIYEGRWLRDPRYMNSYIRYLYAGGNNRRYSESIADATYARFLVNADSAFVVEQLESMRTIYDQWSDHWDSTRQLYYIPAMPDATEYTIASIDASGGTDGFEGGDAFRPTINSYQYANAKAIARIAALKGDVPTNVAFTARAASLKSTIEKQLWNPTLKHFTDRFEVDNAFVHNWDFIRGRELAGMVPWYFNLPSDSGEFNEAWRHVIDTTGLLGAFGYRTNEPSYEYYFKQFVFFQGKRGSQWNGPSWPYQSSQVLTAMANFLHNYQQNVVTKSDYVHALRLFTRQHYLPNGKINLVENYDPNLGGPIVHFYWSNHYNHSSYNNLIITGLCGVQPAEGKRLIVDPLVDASIAYFLLDHLQYHGHDVTILYDRDGTRYNRGEGIRIFVDGEERPFVMRGKKYEVEIGDPIVPLVPRQRPNVALNIRAKGFPVVMASINALPDSVYQAVDGRTWFFQEVMNGWTTQGSTSPDDWYAIDFGELKDVSSVKLYPIDDDRLYAAPKDIRVEYWDGEQWKAPNVTAVIPTSPTANRWNTVSFEQVATSKIRINIHHPSTQVFLSEVECY